MNRPRGRIVNVNREFTFTEIINKAFRIGVSPEPPSMRRARTSARCESARLLFDFHRSFSPRLVVRWIFKRFDNLPASTGHAAGTWRRGLATSLDVRIAQESRWWPDWKRLILFWAASGPQKQIIGRSW